MVLAQGGEMLNSGQGLVEANSGSAYSPGQSSLSLLLDQPADGGLC